MLSKKVKIVGSSWGITFETFADTMVSNPNSHLDLMQNESPVKPYKVEGRSSYFINTDPKHFHITLNYLCSRGWGHRGRDCIW
jgi:hypothetical protein